MAKGKKKNIKRKPNSQPKKPKKAFALLATALAFFIIGIHQSITIGFEYSYWIFMLTIVLLFLYQYINKNAEKD